MLPRWVSITGHPFAVTLVLAAAMESRRAGTAAGMRTAGLVAALFVLPLALLTTRPSARARARS